MAILIHRDTRIIIQGITGSQGALHTALSLEYGVKVVGGVVPGRGGESVHGVPVFDSVKQAMEKEKVEGSLILVPPSAVREAAFEALENRVPLTVMVAFVASGPLIVAAPWPSMITSTTCSVISTFSTHAPLTKRVSPWLSLSTAAVMVL